MRESNVFLAIAVLLVSGAVANAQMATAPKTSCAQTLPAGLIIRFEPDEKLVAGKTDGPLLLTVTSDVRLFPGKPPIVPRSSKLFAKTVQSKDAGHLWGKARLLMTIDTILTPNECEYAIDAKLIEAGKFKVNKKEAIVGKGHARRDFILWLFPPTTLYQLIRLPARGPKLILDEESTLAIRLLEPVQLTETAAAESRATSRVALSEAPKQPEPVQSVQMVCPETSQPSLHDPIQARATVIRPLRNMTPYNVSLAIGKDPLTNLAPCFGTMVTMPMGEFTITAKASVLDTGGQRQIPVEIVVNPAGTGWDVIQRERAADAKTLAAQVQQQ